MCVVGVDVGKAEISVFGPCLAGMVRNEPKALGRMVGSLPAGAVVGVEATGRYHRALMRELAEAGVLCYLLNPMHVHRYAKALKPKVKSDKQDAKMIARYVEREQDWLVPFKLPEPRVQELKDLLSYRETLVEKKVALRQSLSEQTFRLQSQKELMASFDRMIAEVDLNIRQLGSMSPLYKRFLTIDGVGPMGAAALVWLFEAHDFASSDQAVAFVGMDVSVRESGKWMGKVKLTKRGPAFVRSFLHNGANSLRKLEELKPLFQHHEAKGLPKTAVNIVVARKILRIAYALAKRSEAHFERKNLMPQLT